MIKITLSDLIQLHNTLEGAKADLEKSLQGIRDKDWREGIDKDKKPSVRILFAELTTIEQNIEKLSSASVTVDWESRTFVESLISKEEII